MKKLRAKTIRFQSTISLKRGENPAARGFTLVEILIVVIILGILASIIIPKFSTATVEARENMMRENLRILRTQIATYRAQHWDISPGYDAGGNPDEQAFIDQMTMFTDEDGNTDAIASAVFRYGPYMSEIPENPLNAIASVNMIADGAAMPAAATNNDGWVYKPEDIIFRSDSPGNDMTGRSYFSY